MKLRILHLIAIVVCVTGPIAGAYRVSTDLDTYSTPDLEESVGPAEAFRDAFAAEARALANLSSDATGAQVADAVTQIERRARENVTGIRDAVNGASNMTLMLRASYEKAHGVPLTPGLRTNLASARAGLLADGVVLLYAELGQPLTMDQEMALRTDGSTLPLSTAVAAAVAVYALIDAIHYSRGAFEDVDFADAHNVLDKASEAAFVTAGVDLDTSTPEYTLTLNPHDLLNGSRNVTRTLRSALLYQAADVLAQAADEIAAMTIVPPVTERDSMCGAGVAFYSHNCLVILGRATDSSYAWMEYGRSARQMNSVLLDFGGNDVYRNHAGAGYMLSNVPAACDPLDSTYQQPVCFTNLQLQLDLGAGTDQYISPTNSRSQWSQGSGSGGVGILYDGGGDDRYNVTRASNTQNAGYGQGFASLGVGMLVDAGGNDVYEAFEQSTKAPVRAQAAAIGPGIAILHDAAGADKYYANMTSGTTMSTLAGGFQASATAGGIAYLVDEGSQDDIYEAGQQYVQAAASFGGFAYFMDQGGRNTVTIVSGTGCHPDVTMSLFPPEATTTGCTSGGRLLPTAGWGQGYADTGGFASLSMGTGDDRYLVRLHGATRGEHEDVGRLGSAGPGGVAIFLDTGGDDVYGGVGNSVGFGDFGIGIFSDRGNNDRYNCAVLTCHAHSSHKGLAVYYDGVSSGDYYADGLDPTVSSSWRQTEGGFALGHHAASTSGGTCCSSGGGLLGRQYYIM